MTCVEFALLGKCRIWAERFTGKCLGYFPDECFCSERGRFYFFFQRGFMYVVLGSSMTSGSMHVNAENKKAATVNNTWQAIINRPAYGEVNNDNQDD